MSVSPCINLAPLHAWMSLFILHVIMLKGWIKRFGFNPKHFQCTCTIHLCSASFTAFNHQNKCSNTTQSGFVAQKTFVHDYLCVWFSWQIGLINMTMKTWSLIECWNYQIILAIVSTIWCNEPYQTMAVIWLWETKWTHHLVYFVLSQLYMKRYTKRQVTWAADIKRQQIWYLADQEVGAWQW